MHSRMRGECTPAHEHTRCRVLWRSALVAQNTRVLEARRKTGAVAAPVASLAGLLRGAVSATLYYGRAVAVQLMGLWLKGIVWIFLNNLSSARRAACVRARRVCVCARAACVRVCVRACVRA